jgi:hypothetical protein
MEGCTPINKGADMYMDKDALARKIDSDFASKAKDIKEKESDPVSSNGKTGPTYRNATRNPIEGAFNG